MSGNTTDLLEGVRVLDLSQYIPGPYATLQMAKLGAEVIKIEPPGGDPMRFFAWGGADISPVYQHLNQGKKVVELDLKSENGKSVLKPLIESANVLLEGFRPGTLERLGFSYAELIRINPQLIVCRISGFGQTGERAQRAGHDLGYGAYAGLYSHIHDNAKPQIVFPPVADHAGALNALALVSAALYRQQNTGKGCELDISLSQSVADWQYLSAADSIGHLIGGGAAYYNFYQTKDGQYVSLAAIEPKFWRAFCEVVDRPEWIIEQKASFPQIALIAKLGGFFKTHTLRHWQLLLDRVDCCFEPVIRHDLFKTNKTTSNKERRASDAVHSELQFLQPDKVYWENR